MKRRNITAITVLVAIIVVLAFFQTPLMGRARSASWTGWVYTVGRLGGLGRLGEVETVFDDNARLAAENFRLKAELRDYARLRRQLGDPAVEDLRAIPAVIMGRPIDTWGSQLVINKGISDGITLDAPVVIQDSVLVGFVRELHEHSAVAELLLNPATSLTVETVVEDKEAQIARGLLESRYYTSLLITTVPRDLSIEDGQTLVTTGKEGGVPFGLVIGELESIQNAENEVYQQADVRTPYDVDNIDAVHILVAP